SGATVFVEPMSVVESGNSYREATVQEEKEVERILRALSGHVGAEGPALRDTIAALAELDLWFAAAGYGARIGGCIPEVTPGPPRLDFRRARHPLLPGDEVVPIDVGVGDDFRVLVITGPNTGGKTVALKSVGLLTVMAQAGLPIPCAEGSALGVFDAVWADIGDEQSIEQSLSTFSGHMTNIVGILEAAGPRSLVLLDELGAGTDPSEGAALAVALLEAFRARGSATVASTHYSELKAYAHQTEAVTNASVEFDVESLRPTYELSIGLPGRSNALAIARRLGLPEEVLAGARGGIEAQHVALEDMLAEIHAARSAAAEDRAVASESRRDADAWAHKLDRALARLEREREDILARAREQAAEELRVARKAIRRLEGEARAAAKDAKPLGEVAARAEAAAEGAAALAKPGAPAPKAAPFVPVRGEAVLVRGYQQAGEILAVRRDGKVEVAIGHVRLTVPPQDLASAAAALGDEAAAPARPLAQGRGPGPRRPSAGPAGPTLSVDLRGLRVDEGLDRLDAHLDRAVLADAPWVHVIHGHGTGAMKRAVRDALSDHPQVSAFRPGKVGEGGDGVTVVRLR
ncbi:MAG: endonuclease MutS2, partial [Anaerolineae bacterium]